MQRNREDPTADSEKPEPMIALPGSPHHIDTGSPLYSAGANLNIYRTHSLYIRYVHSPKTEELKGKKLNTHTSGSRHCPITHGGGADPLYTGAIPIQVTTRSGPHRDLDNTREISEQGTWGGGAER